MKGVAIEIREMTISDDDDVAALWKQTENVGLSDAGRVLRPISSETRE